MVDVGIWVCGSDMEDVQSSSSASSWCFVSK